MIDGKIFFDQTIKYDIKTADQRDDQKTDFLLDYNYFIKHYKVTVTDLMKKQVLDVNPKAITQVNFTGIISGNNNRLMFSIIEKVKETILDFSQWTIKVL